MASRNIVLKKRYTLSSALNLLMPENSVMTSACAHPSARTGSGSRGKKLSRVEKGVPDMYVAFRLAQN